MIRTLLVDDEPDSILVLRALLEINCPDVAVIGEADGVQAAIPLITKESPDLLLLDISMTDGSAFDLLSALGEFDFQVIFISAYDTHALEAFKYSAVDYLLKPVDGGQLKNAVNRAIKRSGGKGLEERLKVLLGNLGALQVSQQKIAVPTISGLTFVFLKDILRIESSGSYANIILADGKQVMTVRSIREYEELLPGSIFYRVHNSHIVNLNRVQSYQKGRGGYVIMEDDSSIEVAIRRKEEFLRKLLK
ncbi:MAG TPA: LytTR family DNA-binding domain-containing protein [Puia sp.]|nr:LytTR family DNA-binding domain-containing protein [Puia sp.]